MNKTATYFSNLIEEVAVEYTLWGFDGRRICSHAFPFGTFVIFRSAVDQALCFLEARITSDRGRVIGIDPEDGEKIFESDTLRSNFASR